MAKATPTKKSPAVSKRSAAKKTAKPAKKTSGKSGEKASGIKYSDKSEGQPQLVLVFKELVKLLKPYAKGSLKLTGGTGGAVGISSQKTVEIAGRKQDELYLAGALVQKGYVGFYYFPIYVAPDLKPELSPLLLKTLKGKTCFHIKKMDAEISAAVADALKKGYEMYRKNGWIS